MRFSESPAAVEWLSQLNGPDRIDGAALLDAMLLVGMDTLIDGIRSLALGSANRIEGPVGLYVERELKNYKGRPKPLFNEMKVSGRNQIRAVGAGPSPISPNSLNPEVGSEGILAWLTTELCREHPRKFVSHPGPDEIRERKIRAFFLITDFIGSGKRASNYLEAAWRVRSVKSWHSGRQIQFCVIGYSGTTNGIRRVQSHETRPEVLVVNACPTIADAFKDSFRLKLLCRKYDPISNHPSLSLGFGGVGALIAFSHGCPNNVPRFLFRSKVGSPWKPLFASRVTAQSRSHFPKLERSSAVVQAKLLRLGDQRLADSPWLSRLTEDGRVMLVVLTALRRGPRFDYALSQRTGLTIPEIGSTLAVAQGLNWVNGQRRLTEIGMDELQQARRRERQRGPLPKKAQSLYIPTSLRML